MEIAVYKLLLFSFSLDKQSLMLSKRRQPGSSVKAETFHLLKRLREGDDCFTTMEKRLLLHQIEERTFVEMEADGPSKPQLRKSKIASYKKTNERYTKFVKKYHYEREFEHPPQPVVGAFTEEGFNEGSKYK